MRFALLLFIFASCAHQMTAEMPSWVTAIRQGEESLKVVHGDKVFYRRIAGGAHLSKEASCELAVTKAEEDIRKEFSQRISYNVEVLVYDLTHKDCATTLSVSKNIAALNDRLPSSVDELSEDAATEMLQKRAEVASRFAIAGMTRDEFEKYAQDKVYLAEGQGDCHKYFQTSSFSIHGSTLVCWQGEHVVGYCTTGDGKCWVKRP